MVTPYHTSSHSVTHRSLSNFQRLLILRALRPDKFVPAVATFVTSTLGPRFTEPPPFDLASAFADSSATTPLLFVLSPGTDPTASLLSFAESRGQSGGKLQVSTYCYFQVLTRDTIS
jgi:dynein heavy chain